MCTRAVNITVFCEWHFWSFLTDRMGVQPIFSFQVALTIDTMLNFDGDFDGHGDGTCKQTLNQCQFFRGSLIWVLSSVLHFRVTLDHGAQVCLYRWGGTLPRQSAEKRLDLATQPPAVCCLVLHILLLFLPQSRRGTVLCERLATTAVYRILL